MQKRGVPSRWPVYDRQDRQNLTFADIRGGFHEQLEKASRRYGRGPVLSASLSWSGKLWQSSWTLVHNQTEYRWSHKGSDYNDLIKTAINQVVDKMGEIYAVRELAPGETAHRIYLNVSHIDSIVQYKRVTDYLNTMPAVRQVGIVKVDAMQVRYVLALRSSEQDFVSLLKNDGELIQEKNTGNDGTNGSVVPVIDEPLDLEALQAQQKQQAALAVPPGAKPASVKDKTAPQLVQPAAESASGQNKRQQTASSAAGKPVYYFRLAK
ncbi:MAG TPA: DUF2066 domain-containing protein [Candidatus Tenderia electrophaga]|uniref:DUF2066 domain-containing protein n=1 Tax=Candidatus Tenderia electrophaga TaxID=1748243 RepID=A0A832N5V1_9GAMM|nr:DUF2066 domain-containing protein [Candidatus Tenderia electrophaga]